MPIDQLPHSLNDSMERTGTGIDLEDNLLKAYTRLRCYGCERTSMNRVWTTLKRSQRAAKPLRGSRRGVDSLSYSDAGAQVVRLRDFRWEDAGA